MEGGSHLTSTISGLQASFGLDHFESQDFQGSGKGTTTTNHIMNDSHIVMMISRAFTT